MSTTTEPQWLVALEKGNTIRYRRAELKRKIAAYRNQSRSWNAAADLIEDPPEIVHTMMVRSLLAACNFLGTHKITKMFRLCGIGETFTVGALTPRQRRELVALLRRGHMDQSRTPLRDTEFGHPEDVARRGW